MDGQRIRPVVDEELRGRRSDPATGIGVGGGTDGTVLGVGTGEQAAGGESQRVERGASEGNSGRSVEGQGVDRPVAGRNRRVGCQTKIAGRGRGAKSRRLFEKIKATDSTGGVVGGEFQVGASGRAVRRVDQRPGADDSVGIRGEPRGGSQEERVRADDARSAHEGQSRVGSASQAAAQIDGSRAETTVARVGAEDRGTADQGEVAEGDDAIGAAAADELERTAVELDGHVGTDAVAHGLHAGIVPT